MTSPTLGRKLSPQKEKIVEILRDLQWHCSSEFGYIKDDRKRISELNEGYMQEKGYEIIGKKCDGRCGKIHSSNLFMRRAVKLPTKTSLQEWQAHSQQATKLFEEGRLVEA